MKFKKIGWLIFCCLVAAGLILVSCGPAEEEEEEEQEQEEEEEQEQEEEEEEEEREEVRSDEPQYGGTVTQIVLTDTRNFDTIFPWS